MSDYGLLTHLILTYAIALVLVVVLARLRIPASMAMMIAGVVAGPSGIGVIGEVEDVEMLGELGIVMVLFTVCLAFSLAALRQIWPTIVAAATLQMLVTAAAFAACVIITSRSPLQLAVFIGLFEALSSTAIVLQGLAE